MEIRTEQSGADIKVSLIYGTVGVPFITEVMVRNADLSAMTDGWLRLG
ncbi:hypothetical protein LJR219_004047 [Phenylobacterium sp. LjRoot219]